MGKIRYLCFNIFSIMAQIDIDAVLREKAPKASRYVPRAVISWLKRIIHQEEINEVLREKWDATPQEFIHAAFQKLGVSYRVSGLERLDPEGRYLFVSNHPFGGMDGMMLADKLIDCFGDVRVVVNDLLMHLEPLRPLWIPVNKHGSQSSAYARRFDEAFRGPLPILTFPAGLCSRRKKGVVCDLEWRPNFLKKARATGRQIVPIHVEGELSNRFYRLSNLRTALGLRFNIEMLYLADEMFLQRGRTFEIRVGAPIDEAVLASQGSLREQATYVKRCCYALSSE